MKQTTVEALGGAQGVPSDLIPVSELRDHLIQQCTTGGNVVLANHDGEPAAVVMSIERYNALLEELGTLRREMGRN